MRRSLPILILFALILVGCGGGSEATTREGTQAAGKAGDHAYVRAADRVCAGMIAQSRRMAIRFGRLPNSGLRALTVTTRELVKPALPVLERSARRLRALEQGADSVSFGSYVSLYDPIVVVVRDRVEAGEAGDATRAHALELQMLDLSDLQRRLAREAGLKTCDVDFIRTFATSGHAQ